MAIGNGRAEPATVWLFAFDATHDVPIARGENAGRTLRYHHVVRELIELGRWRGESEAFELPVARLSSEGRDGIAIVLQRERDGAILAAMEQEIEAR